MSTVKIQFTLFSAFYSPLILTMAGGFLKQEGLDHEWSVSPPGKPATESIADGSADVVQSAPSQAFNAIARGETDYPLHFAQINEMDGFFITGREADADFSWHRLEGAEVVMFGGGQPNAMFRYACHQAGIDYQKIIPITPGGADAIDQAFRAGQGRYVQQQGPYPQQLEQDGLGRVLAQVGPMIGPCAFSSLAASREWLQTEEARAFTRAYAVARQYLNQVPAAEIAVLLQSYFPGVSLTALESCISSYQHLGCWTPYIEITRPAFEVTLDVFEFTGGIAQRYPYEMVCTAAPDVGTE
ncbi:MAG: ABC transporter substrate-binding protein [Gammaproteobacteria bacterium]|nr:ABC transporter substrate-binding protein [Gammaproteobacteria bacterium]MDH3447965.1 ABC transporter substrate-binding protein [Gammaproteobacteria bacterium]